MPARDALGKYLSSLESYELSDILFKSRKGENEAINTKTAWRIMNDMSRANELDKKGINVGTHTMRKTFARKALESDPENNITIETLRDLLNHTSISATQHYIGAQEDDIRKVYTSINI